MTDDGLKGLGEAWRGSAAIETEIHSDVAPVLLGKDASEIEKISHMLLNPYVGFHSGSVEVRAASAIDIALWDLYGKRCGIPVCEALGGASRDSLLVYNTCSGYSFNANASNFDSGNSRRTISAKDSMSGPYDDQIAFTRDAGKLAQSLIAEGFSAMKIWPFDPFAKDTEGNYISDEQIETGLSAFQKIQNAVEQKIDVMCEMHSIWNVPSAIRIINALEPNNIFWAEDPLCKMDNISALKKVKERTNVPICGSETLSGASIFRQMLTENLFDYVMLDLSWCGGLTEVRKIAYLSDSFNIPVAPHDCTGPVLLWAGLQLGMHVSNGLFQEVVRANLASWYKDVFTNLPVIKNVHAFRPTAPGIGTELKGSIYESKDAIIKESC